MNEVITEEILSLNSRVNVEKFEDSKILVTGASGMLGSYIANNLNSLLELNGKRPAKMLAKMEGVRFISAIKVLCDSRDMCVTTAKSFENEIQPFVYDYAHLTPAGSLYLAEKIGSLLVGER
jgi:hypothetical protein